MRELVPGRAAVVAAARALGLLHLAQQRVHLRHRERAVGAHRGVAGHGGEQLVAPLDEHARSRRTRASRAAPSAAAPRRRRRRAAPAPRGSTSSRGPAAPTSKPRLSSAARFASACSTSSARRRSSAIGTSSGCAAARRRRARPSASRRRCARARRACRPAPGPPRSARGCRCRAAARAHSRAAAPRSACRGSGIRAPLVGHRGHEERCVAPRRLRDREAPAGMPAGEPGGRSGTGARRRPRSAAATASARLSAWNTNWCMAPESRKRTSLLAGCTFTSTSARIDLEEEHVGGLAIAVQHVGVGLAHRVRDDPVAHEAAVDEEVLRVARGAREAAARRRGPTRRSAPACASTSKRRRRNRRPSTRARALARRLAAAGAAMRRPLCVSEKATCGARKRDAREGLLAAPELGRLALQELAARRRVEVEVLDLDRGARRRAPRARPRTRARLARDAPRVALAPRARLDDRKARDRADGGERLAAEAQGRRALQVLERGDLAGGEARDARAAGRRARCRAPSSSTCMRRTPPSSSSTATRLRARVEAVLQQFLQRRGGPLDHLAGGDLVDQQLGESCECGPRVNVTLASHSHPPARAPRQGAA